MRRCPHFDTFLAFVRNGGEWAGNHPPYPALAARGVRGLIFADDDPYIQEELVSAQAAGMVVGVNIARHELGADDPLGFADHASALLTELGNLPTVVSLNPEGVGLGYWRPMLNRWKVNRPNRWYAVAVEARKDASAVDYQAIRHGGGLVLAETFISLPDGTTQPVSAAECVDYCTRGDQGADLADVKPILYAGDKRQWDELLTTSTIGFSAWTAAELLKLPESFYLPLIGPRAAAFRR